MKTIHLAILIEFVALVVAMIMPFTPSKTGSQWVPASVFFADPSYFEKVAVNFVLVNLVYAVIAFLLVGLARYEKWRTGS